MRQLTYITLLTILFSNCQQEDITTTGTAKDHFYFENRGATMPVYLEGNITSNKILILVHGGPGDGSLYYNTHEADDIAEREFAIAYWDQRAAGITQGNTMSVKLTDYTDDLKKLIFLLKDKYGENKEIYLMGHSWGGLIVPLFLQEDNNQRLVSGWIQVDGAHDYTLNDALTKSSLISFGQQQIAANHHVEDWNEIVNYSLDHDPNNDYGVARKLNGYAHESETYIGDIIEGRSTNASVKYFVREYRYPITTFISNGIYNNFIKEIDRQAYAVDVSSHLNQITLPTLLLWGKYDFVCPIGLRDDIVEHISSTNVKTVVFNHSGHSPMQNEPVAFWTSVSEWMRSN